MNNGLIAVPPLPQLPVQMHSATGYGLVPKDLIIEYKGASTAEQAMAHYRAEHSAEKLNWRCLFYMEPQGKGGKSAIVRMLLDFEGKHVRVVGKTANDPDAARVLIGNFRAGYNFPNVRWELYGDRACEDLIDMGRFDQWDLLLNIERSKLDLLAQSGIVPSGNWDFNRFLWAKHCSICGNEVAVNSLVFSIDSVVCAKCGNRPFLAPSLHHMLEANEQTGLSNEASLHALRWMVGVGAKFEQVKKDPSDEQGRVIKAIWHRTLMAKALESGSEDKVKSLVESNTGFDFGMYRSCCAKMQKALNGEEPFDEEHKIAIDFVLRTTELMNVRQLTTN